MGAAPLVVLPGLDGTEVFLRPLLASLPRSINPIVVCYPDSIEDGAAYDTLLPRVRDVIERHPGCVVFGWSFGGPLALLAAAAEPERVRAVILAGAFVRAPSPWMRRLGFLLSGRLVTAYRIARRIPLQLMRSASDPWRAAWFETWRRVSSPVIAARLRAVVDLDARDVLCTCPQPILYLVAKNDELVPSDNVDQIVAMRPSVRVVELEGRHLSLFTSPAVAADTIAGVVCDHAAGDAHVTLQDAPAAAAPAPVPSGRSPRRRTSTPSRAR